MRVFAGRIQENSGSRATGQRPLSCDRGARRAPLLPPWHDASREGGDHEPCAHDGPPSRGYRLGDDARPRDGGELRGHDALLPLRTCFLLGRFKIGGARERKTNGAMLMTRDEQMNSFLSCRGRRARLSQLHTFLYPTGAAKRLNRRYNFVPRTTDVRL